MTIIKKRRIKNFYLQSLRCHQRESMIPHRRWLDYQLSRAFKTTAHDLRGRLLNLSSSGSDNGAYFYQLEEGAL